MARTAPRPRPDRERVLETVHRACQMYMFVENFATTVG